MDLTSGTPEGCEGQSQEKLGPETSNIVNISVAAVLHEVSTGWIMDMFSYNTKYLFITHTSQGLRLCFQMGLVDIYNFD